MVTRDGSMIPFQTDAPEGPDELRSGETVRLREPYDRYVAGAQARIIGFFRAGDPEALVEFQDGEQIRIPYGILERVL